jgi:hypothetical protein
MSEAWHFEFFITVYNDHHGRTLIAIEKTVPPKPFFPNETQTLESAFNVKGGENINGYNFTSIIEKMAYGGD